MAKSRSRNLADIIGKKSIYTSNHADVQANNGVTLSQISLDLDTVESKITNDASILVSNSYFQSAQANTNSYIAATQANIDTENARVDLLNTNLTATNTAIRSLISSNDTDISNLQTEDSNLWTGLTGTNTAIRSLVSAESARVDLVNTNLTATNTAIRSLISSNDSDISALQSDVTDLQSEDSSLWSAITSTNNAVRSYTDTAVANLVDSAPATLDTLNELAAALGDDQNFSTTLSTNLGQKLGSTATVTLSGDVSGSASFSANAVTITTTVADDSHNHVISNVDGLQSALDTKATWTGLTGTNTAIRSLVSAESARVDLLNTNLTSTNTAIRSLISSNDTDISNLQTEDSNLWTGLTATNTAIRSLISSNDSDISALQSEDTALWTGLTATNTAIRSLISSNDSDISALQSEDTALWSAITSTNTAVRSYTDTAVANLVDSSPAALDTLNELAAALGDDENFATTVSTNLGQKLGATATVTLGGDVTGTASFNANAISITTDISDSGVTSGTYGSSSEVPVVTVGADGRVTNMSTSTVAGVTDVTFTTANNNLRVSVADGKTYDVQIDVSDKATWSALASTNTAIRALISSNDNDISALQTEDGNLWVGLTATNTAIRSLVSAESARVDLVNTNLTATNTAIRSLISSNDTDISNLQSNKATWSGLTATNTAIRALISSNDTDISNLQSEDTALWSAITSTNTAIRSYTDTAVANLVDTAPAALDTLNELASALGDDENFATTLSTNLGQKLGSTATVTLGGDVTGTASFSSNAVSITTDISDSGVTSGTYGSSTAVPVVTVGADGRVTGVTTQTVAGVTSVGFTSANNNLRVAVADGTTFDTQIDVSDKATWSALTSTNTAIRSLISSNDTDISNLQTEDGNIWTGLTGTNTAIRSLVSAESARVDLVNTNLTATNTAIRSLISSNDTDISNLQTEDSNLWSAVTATNTAIRSITTANAAKIAQVESNLLASNTAIRSYVDTEVASLVDSAPATLDTLNELAAALGDDPSFATTLSTNLGQKLGSSATVTLTGDASGTASFSSNAASIAVTVSDNFASNAHLSSTYVSNTAFQAFAANNNYVFTELAYTASEGQQSFTGADNFGKTLDYTAGKISVFMNGIMLLANTDYEAANTTSVWLKDGASADDVISVQTYTSAQNFVEKNADIDTSSATLSGTSAQTIDSFGAGDLRTVKYVVEIEDTSANEFHSMEILLTHDGTNVVMTQYASVTTGGNELGTIDASISGGTCTVTCTPTVAASTVKAVRLSTSA